MLSKEAKKNQMVSSFYLNRWRYLELFLGVSGEHGWLEGPPVTLEELDREFKEQIFPELMHYLDVTSDDELKGEVEADKARIDSIVKGLRSQSPPSDLKAATRLRSEGLKLRNVFINKIHDFSMRSGE